MTTDSAIRRGTLPFRLDTWTATHVGLKREQNEDAHRTTPARGIFVVADGMGGHPCGEIASTLAVEACHTALVRGLSMQDAFQVAQEVVEESARQDPRRHRMGTTLVAAKFSGDGLAIGWVGDSRVYRYRKGVLLPLTEDHGTHGYLTQYVGDGGGFVGASIGQRSIELGDRILLCSDGLSTYVDEELIRRRMKENKSPRHAVETLIQDSLAVGGMDNVTISVVRVA